MSIILIKDARVVNEGRICDVDVRIKNQRIDRISSSLLASVNEQVFTRLNAENQHAHNAVVIDRK